MPTSFITRALTFTILTFGCLALAACHSPKGGVLPHTGGSFTYYSTETEPKNVRIVDMRNDEVIFAINIPPDKQLTFDFIEGKGDDPVHTPDLMKWEVLPMGTMTGKLRNAMTVPNAASRKIIVDIREGFEYAQAPNERTNQVQPESETANWGWWSPQGGPVPEAQQNPGTTLYDN